VAGSIAAAGLRLASRGPQAADKAMQSATALERSRLERWLAYLGTVGNNAPFVGLFGTVVGVVGAFDNLGHATSATASAGQAASQAVMSSISEALVATAVGIFVALPAVAFYNYFQRRIAQLLSGAEVLTNLVLAYLSTGGLPKGAPPADGDANAHTKTTLPSRAA
jgi:biopolymer transport protein ExbB